jgi:hypothetical protein
MNRDRYVFVPAAAWSGFVGSRFACDAPHLFNVLNYNQCFSMGKDFYRIMAQEGRFKDSRTVGLLGLFPFLAFTGWGRATIGVNSNISRKSEEFVLNVRFENTAETIDVKKSETCRCFMLGGLMAGWSSEAIGFTTHCVEVKNHVCLVLFSFCF